MMKVCMSILDGMIAEDTSCDRGPLLFGALKFHMFLTCLPVASKPREMSNNFGKTLGQPVNVDKSLTRQRHRKKRLLPMSLRAMHGQKQKEIQSSNTHNGKQHRIWHVDQLGIKTVGNTTGNKSWDGTPSFELPSV